MLGKLPIQDFTQCLPWDSSVQRYSRSKGRPPCQAHLAGDFPLHPPLVDSRAGVTSWDRALTRLSAASGSLHHSKKSLQGARLLPHSPPALCGIKAIPNVIYKEIWFINQISPKILGHEIHCLLYFYFIFYIDPVNTTLDSRLTFAFGFSSWLGGSQYPKLL